MYYCFPYTVRPIFILYIIYLISQAGSIHECEVNCTNVNLFTNPQLYTTFHLLMATQILIRMVSAEALQRF